MNMSKKKWLLLFFAVAFLAYTLYNYKRLPETVTQAITYLQTGFNANPLGIVTAVVGSVSAVIGVARLAWTKAKSGYDATVSLLVEGKDRDINSLSDLYTETKTELTSMTGQFNAMKTELDTTRTMLADTQQKLADANAQIQKGITEKNAIAEVKAAETRMAETHIKINPILTRDSKPDELRKAADAQGIKIAVE